MSISALLILINRPSLSIAPESIPISCLVIKLASNMSADNSENAVILSLTIVLVSSILPSILSISLSTYNLLSLTKISRSPISVPLSFIRLLLTIIAPERNARCVVVSILVES